MTPTLLPMAWSVEEFLQNATNAFNTWGGLIATLLGVILLIMALWFTFTYITTDQNNPKRKSIPFIIITFIIAGALIAGGWALANNIASGGKDSIEQLGGGILISLGL